MVLPPPPPPAQPLTSALQMIAEENQEAQQRIKMLKSSLDLLGLKLSKASERQRTLSAAMDALGWAFPTALSCAYAAGPPTCGVGSRCCGERQNSPNRASFEPKPAVLERAACHPG